MGVLTNAQPSYSRPLFDACLLHKVIAENPGAMSMFARLEDFFEQVMTAKERVALEEGTRTNSSLTFHTSCMPPCQISIWPLHVKEDLQRRVGRSIELQ